MATLSGNMAFRGTTAAKLAQPPRTLKRPPTGPTLALTTKRTLRLDQDDPEAVLVHAPGREYLAVLNGARCFSVLHNLHRWKAPTGTRSRFNGRIVAFEGEVLDQHGLPLLFWSFEEEDEDLLQFYSFPSAAVEQATHFYMGGNRDERLHQAHITHTQEHEREADIWACGRLIPISWAHMFLNKPSMGQTYHRMIQLMLDVPPEQRSKLQPFMMALCTGARHPIQGRKTLPVPSVPYGRKCRTQGNTDGGNRSMGRPRSRC